MQSDAALITLRYTLNLSNTVLRYSVKFFASGWFTVCYYVTGSALKAKHETGTPSRMKATRGIAFTAALCFHVAAEPLQTVHACRVASKLINV
jgi:hypothetical protein